MEGKINAVSYPIFSLKWVATDSGDSIVAAAGGGGSSKSGVKNAVTFFKVTRVKGQKRPGFAELSVLDTGATLVSNVAISTTAKLLACGSGDRTVVYEIVNDFKSFKEIDSFQTDFAAEGEKGYQNVVNFNPKGDLIACGGDDKIVRVFRAKSNKPHGTDDEVQKRVIFEKLYEFQGHTDSINNVDWHPDGEYLASCGKGGYCHIWDIGSGKKLVSFISALDLMNSIINIKEKKVKSRYVYRSCGFSKTESGIFFTLQTPSRGISYLSKWQIDYKENLVQKSPICTVPLGNMCACSMAISSKYIAIGGSDGSVSIYLTSTMRRIRTAPAHFLPVTGLCFEPPPKKKLGTSLDALVVLSASADYSMYFLHGTGFELWKVYMLLVLFVSLAAVLKFYYNLY